MCLSMSWTTKSTSPAVFSPSDKRNWPIASEASADSQSCSDQLLGLTASRPGPPDAVTLAQKK